jgi:hypothetical protein
MCTRSLKRYKYLIVNNLIVKIVVCFLPKIVPLHLKKWLKMIGKL